MKLYKHLKPTCGMKLSAHLCAILAASMLSAVNAQNEAEEEIIIELPDTTPQVEEKPVDWVGSLEPSAEEEVSPVSPSPTPVAVENLASPAEPSADSELLNIPEIAPALSTEEEVIMQLPQGGSPAPIYGEEETILVTYEDVEVATVLRHVANLYDLNIVIPPTLVGRISLKLSNVTWRQVFEVVLEATGFTYIEESNIIKIKSLEDLAAEPVDTRVFLINFSSASEIQSSVSPLINTAAGGKIQVDKRSNALIVTERPSRMNQIQEIIEKLDRETKQVKIESKFVEVTDRDAKNIGLDWTSLGGFQLGSSPFVRTFTNSVNQAVDFSNPGPAENWQIPGDDYINQVIRGNPATTGPGYQAPNNVPYTDILTDSEGNLATYTLPTANLTKSTNINRSDQVVMTADGFNVILRALESLTDVKLVSNPTIVTLNNKPALISIGERFPIPNYTYNDERGSYEVSDFQFEDIGIKLEVTPQVNSAGFINLDILPEVSSRQGTVSFGGASGAEIPIIASRRTETSVTLKDGYTLALGGLMENETNKDSNKVPVLGDIPVLGRFFKSEITSTQTRNLIIFITANTLSPDGSDYRDVIDPRMINAMGLRESEIPGYTLSDEERMTLQGIDAARNRIDLDKNIAARRAELEELEAAQAYMKEQEAKEDAPEKSGGEWWNRNR